MNNYLVIILIFSFSAQAIEHETTQSPFVWIVEKNGKTSSILGTIHAGVTLEEIPCSDEVLKKIQNSDLLFAETTAGHDFYRLSKEERSKLFIGSVKEKEEIMSQLSLSTQETIRERKSALFKILQDMFTYRYESLNNEGFTELSLTSQDFLINHGADREASYADFIYYLNTIAYYKAYYSLPSLDDQVKQIALSHSIKIKPLDNNSRLNKDFYLKPSPNKPVQFIDRNDIEKIIKEIDSMIQLYQQIFLDTAQVYRSYDINFFNQVIKEEVSDEQILLKNRNELWLKKFLEEHEEYENIFIAAGLKHFIGSHNLLDMLEDKGFSVERMTCSTNSENRF